MMQKKGIFMLSTHKHENWFYEYAQHLTSGDFAELLQQLSEETDNEAKSA